jgi:ATP-dependent DNA helicase RecG
MALHINIEDLLNARSVETERIEFKTGWNPDAIYRTICAFANDFNDHGGGYIVLGVEETNGVAKRPVAGLSPELIASIQQKMIGFNNQIKPAYHPHIFIEKIDHKDIMVIWVPGGSNRPYQVPEQITANRKNWCFYIRRYANSVQANLEEQQELISLANQIPFDDRANTQASVSSISLLLIQEHLRKIGSKLNLSAGQLPTEELLQQMELITGPNEHQFPRNVALMMFAEKPHLFFPYTWVEIVHFTHGIADRKFTEVRLEGPVPQLITKTLDWLKSNILQEKVFKISGRATAGRFWNYPFAALEEAVANCLYHRNYQVREPVKIRIEPDAIILHNAGGPDRSIRREDFAVGKVIPRRYRNRRLGDFLKELKLTEGHATGLAAIRQAMQVNQSPDPLFDFDEERTWFQVTLPVHPAFLHTENKGKTKTLENLAAIDEWLEKWMQENKLSAQAGAQASNQAGNQATDTQSIENQLSKILLNITESGESNQASNQVSAQVSAQAILVAPDSITLLTRGIQPQSRESLLKQLNLSNHRKNYIKFILPLINMGWMAMTLPDKPTSPHQQYYTTLKGRLLLHFAMNTEIKKNKSKRK